MNTEIEAKFANIDLNEIRAKLTNIGAVLEQPMRLMRRVVIHTPEMEAKHAFVRVRDEGHRTTITYKQFDSDTVDGAKEYEIEASNFDQAINLLSAAGLSSFAYQESKRENWRINNVDIMIDEWPWIKPYIEIEGESEEAIKSLADQLGFNWSDALFGGVANIYRNQYPHIGEAGISVINREWETIKFDDPTPELLTIPER